MLLMGCLEEVAMQIVPAVQDVQRCEVEGGVGQEVGRAGGALGGEY